MVETQIREVDLEALKETLRQEMRRLSGCEGGALQPAPADPAPAPPPSNEAVSAGAPLPEAASGDEPFIESTPGRAESLDVGQSHRPLPVSYKEIAQESGPRFLEKAYRSVLHRSADEAGLAFYGGALRSGKMTKAEVIAHLRFSPEGRSRGVRVSGMWGPLFLAAMRKIPVFGRMFPSADMVQTWIAEERDAVQHAVEDVRRECIGLLEQHVGRAVEDVRREWSGFMRDVVLPRLEAVEDRIETLDHRTLTALEALDALQNDNQAALSTLTARLDALQNDTQAALSTLTARLDTLQNDTHNALKGLDERLQTLLAKDLPGHLREHAQAIALLRQAVADQQRLAGRRMRAPDIAAPTAPDSAPMTHRDGKAHRETLRPSPPPPRDPPGSMSLSAASSQAPFDPLLDALYTALEDVFRGTSEAIAERLRFYLPYVRALPLDLAPVPLVDAGCGRGEWLHLLRAEGIAAVGVDTNPIMVARCREQGLHVLHGDVVSYLRSVAPGSVGAVTAFQLIEHLDLSDLVAFLDAAYESLVPGGLLLCETPNPENLMVSAYYFHFDPSHRRPIPPPVARFLLESRGFACVQVVRPPGSGAEIPSDAASLPPLLQKVFFAAADYAVIARKAPCDHSL
ncbi:methyltransferase domain-containing protein [Desulfosoma sp.]